MSLSSSGAGSRRDCRRGVMPIEYKNEANGYVRATCFVRTLYASPRSLQVGRVFYISLLPVTILFRHRENSLDAVCRRITGSLREISINMAGDEEVMELVMKGQWIAKHVCHSSSRSYLINTLFDPVSLQFVGG